MGNTPFKLIATVEVELQIIDNLNDYLFKSFETKLNDFFVLLFTFLKYFHF